MLSDRMPFSRLPIRLPIRLALGLGLALGLSEAVLGLDEIGVQKFCNVFPGDMATQAGGSDGDVRANGYHCKERCSGPLSPNDLVCLLSLKGWDGRAQGIALRNKRQPGQALKGRHNSTFADDLSHGSCSGYPTLTGCTRLGHTRRALPCAFASQPFRLPRTHSLARNTSPNS
jgi:hypothetical protein